MASGAEQVGLQFRQPPGHGGRFEINWRPYLESAATLKFAKNGYRELKVTDFHHEVDASLPHTQELSRGINPCYERNMSCLDGCEKCYDKQLHSWNGAAQLQHIQRSQYYVQYSRSVRVGFTIILLCLIVFLALHM